VRLEEAMDFPEVTKALSLGDDMLVQFDLLPA
jgi:hypothetical protein